MPACTCMQCIISVMNRLSCKTCRANKLEHFCRKEPLLYPALDIPLLVCLYQSCQSLFTLFLPSEEKPASQLMRCNYRRFTLPNTWTVWFVGIHFSIHFNPFQSIADVFSGKKTSGMACRLTIDLPLWLIANPQQFFFSWNAGCWRREKKEAE